VGQGATKGAFVQQASGFGIIHLAAHGYFDPFNPMFSGVDLEPEKQDDGRLQVYEILRLRLHTQLVTLRVHSTINSQP
jgi:CHAT domain-containing protein